MIRDCYSKATVCIKPRAYVVMPHGQPWSSSVWQEIQACCKAHGQSAAIGRDGLEGVCACCKRDPAATMAAADTQGNRPASNLRAGRPLPTGNPVNEIERRQSAGRLARHCCRQATGERRLSIGKLLGPLAFLVGLGFSLAKSRRPGPAHGACLTRIQAKHTSRALIRATTKGRDMRVAEPWRSRHA